MASSSDSVFDAVLLQNLMGRLQLRPPYLTTNSYLGESLRDFLLFDDDGTLSETETSYIDSEESKVEKDIIRVIHGGDVGTLKPNSGQSVAIGEHHMCVGFQDDPESDYRVWEWHGLIMVYDEENGYSPEYVYGNYFERVPEKGKGGGGNSGIRDIINGCDSIGGSRVVHRNSLKD
ncbi:hypothetical protein QJS10_CPB20g00994 [Acorus calamus]|uniref:Uncharacterized protein n=1 Tax=Acorus calamus TaxID=4465 RepID=A0AAV9CB45_ACOCL|nr:hypothetical protein QJS10_CPB20g00994 [Acorus calamus]